MANLTVIEGGGPPDHMAAAARHEPRMTIIELLRALAPGEDPEGLIATRLAAFTEQASATKVPLSSIVTDMITEMNHEVLSEGKDDGVIADIDHVVISSLWAASESCCEDGLAKARASKRLFNLLHAIEALIVGKERRSRARGSSYFQWRPKQHFPKARSKKK
jgi:hypothetical protein